MIYGESTSSSGKVFKVSAAVIWSSSLFIGVLASIPKILQLQITGFELLTDAGIAFIFSLTLSYYNIYNLPKFSGGPLNRKFFSIRLLRSLLIGILFMVLLVVIHQFLFPAYPFGSMLMMYQFRGILINLTIYMFLHLLYQSHQTQLIGVELERIKADNLGAQYELLKQQVNPHFLFNSLNTLKSMVDIGDRHSSDFILKLSDFYRFTLENRKLNLIPLPEELEILNAYMYLLKARFEDGISLHMEIDKAHEQSLIPPFTLQLLVENCIKHNVLSLEEPLEIRLYSAENHLVVENRLNLKKVPEASTQMGLENINQRYLHLLNQKIEIERGQETFKIKLPVIYGHSDH